MPKEESREIRKAQFRRAAVLLDSFESIQAQIDHAISADGRRKKSFARRHNTPICERLLLAVKQAGADGLLMLDAVSLFPNSNNGTTASGLLMRTENDDGRSIAPLIKLLPGKDNRPRLFYINREAGEGEITCKAEE
jgi:hypothetical protein